VGMPTKVSIKYFKNKSIDIRLVFWDKENSDNYKSVMKLTDDDPDSIFKIYFQRNGKPAFYMLYAPFENS
jgi:hypothetical protein